MSKAMIEKIVSCPDRDTASNKILEGDIAVVLFPAGDGLLGILKNDQLLPELPEAAKSIPASAFGRYAKAAHGTKRLISEYHCPVSEEEVVQAFSS